MAVLLIASTQLFSAMADDPPGDPARQSIADLLALSSLPSYVSLAYDSCGDRPAFTIHMAGTPELRSLNNHEVRFGLYPRKKIRIPSFDTLPSEDLFRRATAEAHSLTLSNHEGLILSDERYFPTPTCPRGSIEPIMYSKLDRFAYFYEDFIATHPDNPARQERIADFAGHFLSVHWQYEQILQEIRQKIFRFDAAPFSWSWIEDQYSFDHEGFKLPPHLLIELLNALSGGAQDPLVPGSPVSSQERPHDMEALAQRYVKGLENLDQVLELVVPATTEQAEAWIAQSHPVTAFFLFRHGSSGRHVRLDDSHYMLPVEILGIRLEFGSTILDFDLREKPQDHSDVDRVYIVGEVRPPKRTKYVAPAFPAKARRHKARRGQAVLEITVGRSGSVEEVHVLNSDPLFEEAAIRAVSQWKYEPAMKDGRAVRVYLTVIMKFQSAA